MAVPVVDEENKLVGIVTVDDVIDVIKDEAAEDLLRLAGVSGDDGIATPPFESFRKRLPWLAINLVTAFVAASGAVPPRSGSSLTLTGQVMRLRYRSTRSASGERPILPRAMMWSCMGGL